VKGHIEKHETQRKLPRGHSCWSIIIETGRTPSGGRGRKRYTFFGTKGDAEAELNRRLHELDTGALVTNERFTVSEYLKHWLKAYAKPSTAPRTYQRYEQLVRSHLIPGLGNHKLAKLTPLHVQNCYAKALEEGRCDGKGGLAPQTVVHLHRVLHKALKQAMRWGYVTRNVADAVTPPKGPHTEATALDEKQAVTLLRQMEGTDLHLPVLLALHTGMRSGEILGLHWRDVDLENAVLTVGTTLQSVDRELIMREPKSNAGRRRIPLMGATVEALKAHGSAQAEHIASGESYTDNDLVVCRKDGNPWHPSTFSAAWIAARNKLGLSVRFHELRHTHASLLIHSGASAKALQERLGHASAAFTLNVYGHLLPGVQERAVTDLEALFGRVEKGLAEGDG
jgi:integrase